MPNEGLIAAYGPGEASALELDCALCDAWAELMTDASARVAVGALLGIAEADLSRAEPPPLKFEVPRAGLAAGEVAIVVVSWLASDVLLGAFKDLAKEVVKTKLRQLWDEHLLPVLKRRLPSRRSLGSEAPNKPIPR